MSDNQSHTAHSDSGDPEGTAVTGLQEAWTAEAEGLSGDGFALKVVARLGQRRRRRTLLLGGTGSIGSAIAGAQMTNLFGDVPAVEAGGMTLTFSGDVLAACVVALTVAIFAVALPDRI